MSNDALVPLGIMLVTVAFGAFAVWLLRRRKRSEEAQRQERIRHVLHRASHGNDRRR